MKRKLALLAAVGSLTLATAACGSDAADTSSSQSEDGAAADTATEAPTDDMTEGMTEDADPAANLVGAGCEDYAAQVPDGAGSVSGMAQDPVATAAGNNPLLTTLTAAVSGELNPDVNLVDTLNGGEYTVFAPVDDAFAQVDQATLDTLSTDADALTNVLTYHVVEGQMTPDEVVGEQTSLQGGTVEVTGEGDMLMVNDATVICGGVQTANATVYLIDTVLSPPQS